MQPLRIEIIDINKFIMRNDLQEVTSPFIHEPSSTNLHPDGFFSERIFGELTSTSRLVTFGYINLNTEIIHPRLCKTIMRLKGIYEGVMSGKEYAIWDDNEKDFIAASSSNQSAKTGYQFFLEHVKDIKFKETDSITRITKIEVLTKFRDRLLIDKYLVLPAGLRDITTKSGNSASEDINKLYSSMFRLSRALPAGGGSINQLYDGVRYAIQLKAIEVYEYLRNIVDGKNGFLEDKYGARNVALATRNVISAASTDVLSPDHPQAIKADETMIPLFQAMKAFQPLVLYHLRSVFLNQIISEGATQISAIDPVTLKLSYISVPTSEKDKFMTTEGLINLINSYRDTSTRFNPVTILDDNGKPHYLYLMYDDRERTGNNDIYMVRSMAEIRSWSIGSFDEKTAAKSVRPLTYAEMFYMATYLAVIGKHTLITRYPITGPDSIYPSVVHLISTSLSTITTLRLISNPDVAISFPHYPVLGSVSIDSTIVHPAHLKPLGGDYDGDTIVVNGILSDEANIESRNHMQHISAVVGASGNLKIGLSTDMAAMTLFNISRIPTKKVS